MVRKRVGPQANINQTILQNEPRLLESKGHPSVKTGHGELVTFSHP